VKLRFKHRLGGSFQEVEPMPDGTGDILMADGGGIQRVTAEGEFRWRTRPFGAHWIAGVFDLDNDGKLEILTSNGREVIILSAETGEFLFRHSVGPPFSYGTYAGMFQVHSLFGKGMQILVPCFSHKEVLMYDCSDGAANTKILHRLWMDDGYHPSTVIGDVNNDGVDEIVIARMGGVYVFDPISGKMISQTLWKSDEERRRNYGHVELADIDSDGNLEAIILSDKVTRHVAVLGNNGDATFYPLWDRFIEHIYPNDTTELRYTTNSIRDFDGDGKLEIAVSIFNENKDNAWHTLILRAETGEMVLDLPGQYLRGVQDANEDGIPELCLSRELAREPSHYGEISIHTYNEKKIIWKVEACRFAERAVHPKGNYSEFKPDVFASHEIWSGAFGENNGILAQSQADGLLILNDEFDILPVGYGTDKSQWTYRVALMENNRIIVSEADGSLKQISPTGTRHFLSCGYHLTTESHIAARLGVIPTVFADGLKRYLVTPDFAGNITIFEKRNNTLQSIAKIRGRSRLGYDGIYHIASVIDTKAGARIVVVDDEGSRHSRLSFYDSRGERTHSFEFPDMPPSSPGNRIGCYDWLYFQHSRGEAMFVSFYQSQSMNSECSLAFLIETGEILWRKDRTGEGEYGRGVGARPHLAWGRSTLLFEDGNPIAVFCAKDTLCHLDLEKGEFVRPRKLLTDYTADAMRAANLLKEQSLSTSSSIEDPFTAYGTPIVYGDDLVIGGCFGGFGILAKDGVAKWWDVAHFGDVLYRMPGIADIDGDGNLELGQGHADGSFRIYDYETGSLRASINLQAISTDVLAFDRKFIIGTNDGRLLTIGHNGDKFAILDEYDVGSAMGSPIAADLDGDEKDGILVVAGDGNLMCFANVNHQLSFPRKRESIT